MQAEAAPREDRIALGIGCMCTAVLFFTAIDTSAKWLITGGMPALAVVFVRYLGHFLISALIFVPREGLGAFRSRRPLLQFLRSTALLTSTIFNFLALGYLPLSITTSIFFASPIVVTLLSIPMLGERVGIRRILAVIVGFGGVLIVIQPWGAQWQPAMLLSLAALCGASCYFVLTRMLAGVEGGSTSQLWASGLASIVLLPVALPLLELPARPSDWIAFLGIGVWGATGHILLTTAHRFAAASVLAPMVYVQLIFANIASAVFFAQWPTIWTLAGALVIFVTGLYIWQREHYDRPPHSTGE